MKHENENELNTDASAPGATAAASAATTVATTVKTVVKTKAEAEAVAAAAAPAAEASIFVLFGPCLYYSVLVSFLFSSCIFLFRFDAIFSFVLATHGTLSDCKPSTVHCLCLIESNGASE